MNVSRLTSRRAHIRLNVAMIQREPSSSRRGSPLALSGVILADLTPKLSPLRYTLQMANNRVVHFEIPANQPEDLTKFYSGLFGWKFQKASIPGPEYWLCDTGADGPGINGAVMKRQDPRQPWMNYVDVAGIDDTLAAAARLGAQIALPKLTVTGVGAYAAIIDPRRKHLRALGTGAALVSRRIDQREDLPIQTGPRARRDYCWPMCRAR